MKQRRRRWWTSGISVIAGLLVLTAVASGLFQLAVLMVPAYRSQLADWVGEVAGQPVEIGGIALRWRGLSPQVELSDILLQGEPGTEFRAERLRLGFSPWQLVQGDWLPRRIALSGLQLTVEIDADGRVRVAGLGRGDPGRASGWRQALSRFPSCTLEDAVIRLRWARWPQRPVALAVDEAQVLETPEGFNLLLDGRLPAGWGGRIQGSARIRGQAEDLDGWSGDWSVLLADLSPQDIWPERWRAGARFQPEALAVTASGGFSSGQLSEVRLNAAARRLLGDLEGQPLPPLESPLLALRWTRDPEGAATDGTVVVEEARVNGQRFGALSLTHRGGQRSLTLRDWSFQPWAPWFALAEGEAAATLASLEGEIDELQLQQDPAVPGLRGEMALRELGGVFQGVRVAGLDARIRLEGQSGRLSPDGGPWTLDAPQLFEQAIAWERFEGDWTWAPGAAGGWQLTAPALRVGLAALRAEGALRLDLPPVAAEGETRSPALALDLRIDVDEVTALKPYRPLHWGAPLRRWLDEALQGGRIEAARLQIDGPLADFPFGARPTGRWQLDLPLRDLTLAYAPGWPRLSEADIDLRFRGAGLEILGRRARSGGLRLRDIEAGIPALQTAELALSARVEGDLADYYRFLRASPLRRNLAGLLDRSEAAGPAALDLQLDLPLRAIKDVAVDGRLNLEDGRLDLAGLDGPVEGLQGELRFDTRTLQAEALSARWQGIDLSAAVLPAEGQPGQLVVGGQLAPGESAAAAVLPAWLRERLLGRSSWQLELGLGPGERPRLSSDLVGVAIDLPTPLGKSAAEPTLFSVMLPVPDQPELWFGFDDQRVSGRLYRDEEGRARGLDLQLGGLLPPPRANGEGLAIRGRLPQAELGDWLALRPASGGEGLPLQKLDLQLDRVRSGGFGLRDQRLQAERVAEGWLLTLDGAARGQLRWAADGGLLSGELDAVALEYEALEAAPLRAPPRALELDPRGWPAVRLDLAALSLNGYPLGRGRLRSTPGADDYRLDELQVGEESLEIAMQGRWWRREGARRAALEFRLSSTDAESTLQAFGYVPNVSAERAELSGDLRWPADAPLHWSQAEGTLDLLAERGTLRAVNPGAGRVLGLVNFYALPRRLALDFRDLTDAGMRFDRIGGRFQLEDGIARTEDLALTGPSLRLQIRGDVDLANRRLDQRVTVLPGMSGGITLGATLLGGPAAGVLMLIAQELLEKPLDQITQFGYRVRGPWEQPEVTPLDAEALLAPAPVPAEPTVPAPAASPAPEAPPP
jgi:uncharacterized protein (TIGR02099 family)